MESPKYVKCADTNRCPQRFQALSHFLDSVRMPGVKQVLGANFLHSPDPIEDENDAAFPKARGLVRAGYQG